MLAHVGGHDGVPGDRLLNGVQNLAGGQLVPLLHHLGLPQGEDMFLPRLVVVLGQALVEQLQHPMMWWSVSTFLSISERSMSMWTILAWLAKVSG